MSYEQKMSNPETGRMFDEYARLIRETIEIPNAMLRNDSAMVAWYKRSNITRA